MLVNIRFVLLVCFITPLHADLTVDCGGNPLTLSATATLQVVAGSAVTFKGCVLRGLAGEQLVMQNGQSKLILQDSSFILDGNYSLSQGSMEVRGKCAIEGVHTFTCGMQHVLIRSGSQLRLGPGLTLDYLPTGSNRFVIQFEDDSAELFLDGATLRNCNPIGMQLSRGNVLVDGHSTIDSTNTTTDKALVMGSGPNRVGNCTLRIRPGATLRVRNAGVVYRSVGADALASSGSIDVAFGGNFVIETLPRVSEASQSFALTATSGFDVVGTMSVDLGGFDLTLNLDLQGVTGTSDVVNVLELSGANVDHISDVTAAAWRPSGDYFAAAGSTLNLYEFNGSSLVELTGVAFSTGAQSATWTQDGQYLALGFSQHASNNEVQVYRFDIAETGSVDLLTSETVSAHINSVAFSPDGRFLAAGGAVADNANVRVYAFDGVSLTLLPSTLIVHGNTINSVDWSPCGRFLAVGGDSGGGVRLRIYHFTGEALIELATSSPTSDIGSVRWAPMGVYLVVLRDTDMEMYSFDDEQLVLLPNSNKSFSAGMRQVSWAPNGRDLVVVGDQSNNAEVVRFDGSTLTSVAGISHGGASIFLDQGSWHPNGKVIGVGGNQGTGSSRIRVYEALSDPVVPTFDIRNGTVEVARGRTVALDDVKLRLG